jgi:hypothetical protein
VSECWHHVFRIETHRLQFLIDLDVNATDKRIYSEFRGLLQDGFRILQIFLLDVSARSRQRTESDSRRKAEGPTCIGCIISELKRCLVVNCLIDAIVL